MSNASQSTPQSLRTHIGFFGRCNVGKSSLINALCGQTIAIVSEVAGTTTDAVVKSIELGALGPCVLIDTAGFDDSTALGQQRRQQSERAAQKCDLAVIVCGATDDYDLEREWIGRFERMSVPTVVSLGKCDMLISPDSTARKIEQQLGVLPLLISASRREGMDKLLETMIDRLKADAKDELTITGGLVGRGDSVVLVMPQDSSAPKGRLIMPQVQTLRELLDLGCVPICCQPAELDSALARLTAPPRLIITDSQVFGYVAERVPEGSMLTSFSVLMACYKGDAPLFVEGAKKIEQLTEQSRVLIAEACSHAPASEDIGRVKLPAMLRRKVGARLQIDVVGGDDFPADLTPYDLVIHCGACMFTRRHVLARVLRAEAQGVAMTNYGIAIAHLQGILPRVVWPQSGK